MQLIHVNGCALASPENMPLAHCISLNARMGAGFALQVEQRYHIRNQILEFPRRYPGLAIAKRGERIILNLITKLHHSDKPALDTFRECLEQARDFLHYNGFKSLATVELGCGLDRIKYQDMIILLCEVFYQTDIKIFMHHL